MNVSGRTLRQRAPNRRLQAQAAAAAAQPQGNLDPVPVHDFDSSEDSDADTIAEFPPNQTPPLMLEGAFIAHLANLRGDIRRVALQHIKHMGQEYQHARERLEQMPASIETDVLLYIPKKPEGWTDEEEAALLQDWAESPERQSLAVEVKEADPTWVMWKAWLRFFHTAPSCFISAQNGLQYHQKTEGGRPDPNWSEELSACLRQLPFHGIFRGCVELLHLALLWVPICRQDYRGPIRWRNPTSDILLTNLARKMRQHDGSKTVKDLHSEVRAPYGPRGPASFMSDLLQGIEKRVFAARPADAEPPAPPKAMPVFDLSVADLRVVEKAANAVTTLGFPAFYPMAASWCVVANTVNSNDFPNTNEELQRVRTAAALSVQRYEACPQPDDLEQDHV
ncbi:hypothetical protein PG997_007128 [Apiospora hydei]|uniref:Uncharacterized protein n=1 Tax=Apiospora hydei TaxID=1337664 RepID=A0ABR1WQU4_9PEZI